MNADAMERARSLAYDVLGRWLSGAVDEALWQDMRGLFWQDADAAFNEDEEAARYQRFIGFNVLPFASVYLEAEGQLGGRVSTEALDHYAASGFTPPADAPAPDHVAVELAFMSRLSAFRAEALKAGAQPAADRWGERLQAFMTDHVLHWMPIFLLSLRRQEDDRYAVLADMLLEVVLDHHAALPPVSPAAQARPEAPDLMARPETTLKDIAVYVTRPVWSGLFVARDDIGRLGRTLGAPIGFGDRGQIMTNLFRSAVSYDRLNALLDALRYLVDSQRFALEAISEAYPTQGVADAVTPWVERLRGTSRLIDALASGARQLEQGG
ncbi:MAG: molecular chaperone TorD family protein [Rhodothermales bacterium]